MNGLPWTAEDNKYLIIHYPHEDSKLVAKHLNRTITALYGRVSKLSLYKTEEAKRKFGGYTTGKQGIGTRFKKGHIPANKGKKMSPEQYAACFPTMFKKGMECNTKLPIGSVTTRTNYKKGTAYRWIKIDEPNKWKELHRYNWEKEHGRIPDKMNVIFKNGDYMNCDVKNLELVDDSDLMSKNTIHGRYPKELRDVIMLLGQLKRKIKNHE